MRVVIDTNVVIAARWNSRSAAARVLQAIHDGKVQLLWSEAVQKEIFFILDKVKPSASYRQFIEALFIPKQQVVNPPSVRLSEDPEDDKFLAVALAGPADLVVSNDRHLLDLHAVEGIPIVSSGVAVQRIEVT